MKVDADKLDQLIRQRLGRLGQAPVDTADLQRRLEAALWQQQHRPWLNRPWMRRVLGTAVAALLMVAAGTFLVVQGSGTRVIAAPVAVAQLHNELVAGQVSVVPVSSIEQANRYLTTQWSEMPLLPDPTAATVTSCCKQNLQNRKVACVLMDYRDQRVTMMVGRSRDLVCGARHTDTVHNGKHYAVHESDGLQMVMIENKGRWICLMSHLSVDSLIELADSLRF